MAEYERDLVVIRCFDTCVYTLRFPQFFLQAGIKNCRTLLKFLFQFAYKNPDTIAFLDKAFPTLCENTKEEWRQASKDYADGYQSTDRASLPPNLFYRAAIVAEIKARKLHNEKLLSAVKKAKRANERAEKLWEGYTEAKEKYM